MILPDLDARMADPADRAAILDAARTLESVLTIRSPRDSRST